MKVCTCFLLFGIFAYTKSLFRIRPKGDYRVVRLPQETVRKYSNEEYSGDTNNLDNVHHFITRGTTVQDKNTKRVLRASRVETLTDFILKAVHILNSFEDTAFEDFFHILDNEIRKYHYTGCKFSELTQNSDTRSLLIRSLKLIRGKPVSFTKANINQVAAMLRDESYDKHVKDLLDYINSLYINTELDFHSVLNNLKYYRNTKTVRTHNNLVHVIRGMVRAVLFNPYTELNTRTRTKLKERIDTFWKRFKNNPAPSAEMNGIPYTGPVIKSVSNSFKVFQNVMSEVNNPEFYSKNDQQVKSENKRERFFSIETSNERFQVDESEKDESVYESEEQITNYNTDEISSGQSLDSSSNSIKNSQERYIEYNTQRYMTLYTEEIPYKPKTTKKTEINPISANVTTKRPKVKKRSTTTSTPRESDVSSDRTENIEMLRARQDTDDTKLDNSYSSHDRESGLTLESKHEPRVRTTFDKPRKQGKADESRSKSKHKNVKIFGQYDAVINVQLANTELLESLRNKKSLFEPLGMDPKYKTALNRKAAIQTKTVPIKSTIRTGSMRAEVEDKAAIPTDLTKSPSMYSKRKKHFFRKQLSDYRENKATPLPNEGKNQHRKYLSPFDNEASGAEDFNTTEVIKRLNVMESELIQLKQVKGFCFRSITDDKNTDVVKTSNSSIESIDKVGSNRKDIKRNVTEEFLNEDHDLNNEKVNNTDEFIRTTESSTTEVAINISKINVVNIDFDKIFTKNISKEVNNNNVTTTTISIVKVTNTTKHEDAVTTPRIGITRRTMAYSEPPYYYDTLLENRPVVRDRQFDTFFDHINDGIDLHM